MTLYELGQRFVGELNEIPGSHHEPFIQFCFTKCGYGSDTPDEVAWCSAWVNGLAWLLRLPRSKSAAARSWLTVGVPVRLADVERGDVVILKRGLGPQPGPEVTSGAAGHVGLYAGIENERIILLGGNQSNGVTLASFPLSSILGIRRIES